MIYLPKSIQREGFDGELVGYTGAVTLTLVKPGVSHDLIMDSLRGVIAELELREKEELGKNR